MNEWPRTLQWMGINEVSQSREEASWVWAAAGFSLLQHIVHHPSPRSVVLKGWCLDQDHQHHLETCSRCKLLQTSWIRNSGVCDFYDFWKKTTHREEWTLTHSAFFPPREPKVTQRVISAQVFEFQPQGSSPALGVNWAHQHLPPLSGASLDDTGYPTEGTTIPAPRLWCTQTLECPGKQGWPCVLMQEMTASHWSLPHTPSICRALNPTVKDWNLRRSISPVRIDVPLNEII